MRGGRDKRTILL